MTGNPNTDSPTLIWANLIHLSYNMWEDRFAPERARRCYDPRLRFDDALWNDLLIRMRDAGMNMIVLDLGDGVRYESHPEIAVQNAWSVERLREEITGMRKLGIEPIPKLNFASTHDAWLGEYSRRVSTPEYYAVCGDLIDEVAGIFDRPRFFHLGMDEETAEHQRYYAVEYCRATIPRSRLLGFMQTPWLPTQEAYRQAHEDAIDQVGECIRKSG